MAETVTLASLMEDAYSDEGITFEDVVSHKGYLSTGNIALDFILGGGIPKGRTTELYGPSQSGKAQPLDALVLTPTGFRRMGDLQIGDTVIDPEGHPSEVLGVFPQGEKDIYRLTFSDGSTCESTKDHLWPLRYRAKRRTVSGRESVMVSGVVPLAQVMSPSRFSASSERSVLGAELRSDLDFAESPLPVDPYLLGLLLGDGGLGGSQPMFTSADQELVDSVSQALPAGVWLREASRAGRGVSYRLTAGNRGGRPNPLTVALRELGIMGHLSDTKFVPEQYKLASAKTRLAVLQGLLDTDAEACARGGAAIFGSASKQLRDDVVWLARSLGFRAVIGERQVIGERVGGGEYFFSYSTRVTSRLAPLFRLRRKVERWQRRSQTGERLGWVGGVRPRVLMSVEFSRRAEAQCIAVSAPSHLYVTDDFIPTHNTTLAAMVAAQCQRAGLPVLYLDYEQALDTDYLRDLGVDTEDRKLFLPYPAASLEAGAEVATRAIATGQLGCVIFDSVAAMTPAKIINEDGESRTTGMERARLLTNLLNKMNPSLARTGTAAIFINHERTEVNTAGGRPGMPPTKTTVGGTALKYYASTRVRFVITKKFKGARIDPLTGDKIEEVHSVTSLAEVTKNKTGAPFQRADLYLVLGQGFSNPHAAMGVLVGAKVVRKGAGGIYTFPEDLYNPSMASADKGPTVRGLQNVLDLADGDVEWGGRLLARAQAVLAPHGSPSAERVLLDDPDGAGSELATPAEGMSEGDVDEMRVAAPAPVPSFADGPSASTAFRI